MSIFSKIASQKKNSFANLGLIYLGLACSFFHLGITALASDKLTDYAVKSGLRGAPLSAHSQSKKVVLFYSDTGPVRRNTALDLKEQILLRDPETQVILKNIWDFTPKLVSRAKSKGWVTTLRQYGFLKDIVYQKALVKGQISKDLHRASIYHMAFDKGQAYQFLQKEAPDSVIAMNYSSAEILRVLKQKGYLKNINTGFQVTDFVEGYGSGIAHDLDQTFLPHPAFAELWQKQNVSPEKYSVTGMPARKKLFSPNDKTNFLRGFGLSTTEKTVLIAGSSDDDSPFSKLVESFVREAGNKPLQIVVATGPNGSARKELERLSQTVPANIKLFSKSLLEPDDMQKMIRASDLFVSGSTGPFAAEGFTVGKPMVIYTSSSGGSKLANVQFFNEQKLAKVAEGPNEVGKLGIDLLKSPADLEEAERAQAVFRQSLDMNAAVDFALLPKPALRGKNSNFSADIPFEEPELPNFANAVRGAILEDPNEAFKARFFMMRNAEKTLDINTYFFRSDEVGFSQLALLRDAARRGVKVRLLLDAHGGRKVSEAMRQYLLQEGVQIKEFRERSIKKIITAFRRTHRRMHDKYVGADGTDVLLGGRNAEDAYYGLDKNHGNYDDLEIHLQGSGAENGEKYFDKMWNSGDARLVRMKKFPASAVQRAELTLNQYDDVKIQSLFPSTNWSEPIHFSPVKSFRISSAPVDTLDSSSGVAKDLISMFRRAKNEIVIISPYFILTDEMKEELKAARKRGVALKVLTNSRASHDNFFISTSYRNELNDLKQMGAEAYEYRGPNTLHTKVYYIDGAQEAAVSSYNMDPRSYNLNTEVAAFVENDSTADPIARRLVQYADDVLRNSDDSYVVEEKRLTGRFKCTINTILKKMVSPPAIRDFL